MVADTVFSDRGGDRKPGRFDGWAFARGLIAFIVTLAALLASAWLSGNLRREQTAQPSAAVETRQAAELPVVTQDPAPAPTSPAPIAHAEHPADRLEPVALFPHSDGIEVLSSEELAAISQAHSPAHRTQATP